VNKFQRIARIARLAQEKLNLFHFGEKKIQKDLSVVNPIIMHGLGDNKGNISKHNSHTTEERKAEAQASHDEALELIGWH